MAVEQIELELIQDNPYNPRKHYAQTKVREMAQSLREVGLRQVPEGRRVDGRVQLAYGHMRKRGFLANQKKDREHWETMPVDVKEISDQDMFHFSMAENLTRTDITPLEVARCIESFSGMFPDVLDEEIAKKHSMTAANVSNMKRVLHLPEKLLEKIDAGVIGFTQGRELLTLEGLENAENLMSSALGGLRTGNKTYGHSNTVEGLQASIHAIISGHYRPLDKDWEGYRWDLLFDTREAGCLKCDKMIRTHPNKSQAAHYCTDGECWDRHDKEHREKAAVAAKTKMEDDILKRAVEKGETVAEPTPGKIETYRIQNVVTRKWWEGEATSLDAACNAAGWKKEDCWVRVKTKKGGWSKRFGDMPTTPPPTDISQEMSAQWSCGQCNVYFSFTPPRDNSKALVECPSCQYEYVTYRRADGVLFCLPKHTYDEPPKVKIPSTLLRAAGEEQLEPPAEESKLEILREKANLERPVGEVPCDTCLRGKTCDRSFFYTDPDSSGRLVCDQWQPEGFVEQDISQRIAEAPAPAPQEVPDDLLEKAKAAAGTRAEVLDLRPLYADDWRHELKGGFVNLSECIDQMDDPAECLERCTRGFHYAFDSKFIDRPPGAVCTDPKCVSRKKSALTRKKNATGQARKKAEVKAVKEAIAQTTTLDRPRIKLILLAQMDGRHTQRSYYGGGDGKYPETWLWERLSAGTPQIERKRDKLFKRIDKLTDEELAKLVVEFMFYYLTNKGDIGSYEIKADEPLKWMGIKVETREE